MVDGWSRGFGASLRLAAELLRAEQLVAKMQVEVYVVAHDVFLLSTKGVGGLLEGGKGPVVNFFSFLLHLTCGH